MKKISLLCIGTELLDGTTQDRNLYFLGKYLESEGLKLKKASFCDDTTHDIAEALDHRIDDLLIISGGLGPTKDDITKSSIASALDLKLEFNQKALEIVQKQFETKNKNYQQENYHYHMIPQHFEAVFNPVGFAPGIYSEKFGLLVLPGVPSEFSAMLDSFLPTITSRKIHKEKLIFRTNGIPEIQIFTKLDTKLWGNLEKFGEVSSLPQNYGVDLGIKLEDRTLEALEDKKKAIIQIMQESPISSYIWSNKLCSIAQTIHSLLIKNRLKISTAESCTGGMIANNLTDIAGSSAYFQGSIVAYQNHIKTQELAVSAQKIQQYSVVSEEVSQLMAQGAMLKFQTDYAISTTGHLEYQGNISPHVWITIASKKKVDSKFLKYHKDRAKNKSVFSEQALHFFREILIRDLGEINGNEL